MFTAQQTETFLRDGYATFQNYETNSFSSFDLVTKNFFESMELYEILGIEKGSDFSLKSTQFGPFLDVTKRKGFARIAIGTDVLRLVLSDQDPYFGEGFSYKVSNVFNPHVRDFHLSEDQMKRLYALMYEPAKVIRTMLLSINVDQSVIDLMENGYFGSIHAGLTYYEPYGTINGTGKIAHRDILKDGITGSVGFTDSKWFLGTNAAEAQEYMIPKGTGFYMNCLEDGLGTTRIVHDLFVDADETRTAFILSMRGEFVREYLSNNGLYVPTLEILRATSPANLEGIQHG